MSDPIAIAQAYLDTWNEADEARRLALLQRHWRDDASYVDPMMAADGVQAISGLISAVHQRFPGFRFLPTRPADGHGDHVRLAWSLGPDGATPPIEGSDVVRLEGGRIRQVIGFLDRVPAAA